jgi:type I restriction enzyme S subunit
MTSRLYKLSELCEIVSSKRVFAASYQSTGIPFFRGKEISQLARGETVTSDLFISIKTYEDLIQRTGAVGVGDILLTAVGTLGNPYQVESSVLPFYFKDGNVVWLRKFVDQLDATYLHYWLGSEHGRRKVLDTAIGSTQAALTITALNDIEIQLPSKAVQSKIVRIISSIDSAILLNRQISTNLESITQLMFRSWFIDFDPVKAKIAGEKPVGMDDATAGLFPDSMEESDFGAIPMGWRWGSVGDIGTVIDCLHSKKPELLAYGRPYLQLDTIHDDGILRFEKAAQINDVDYKKWTARIEVKDGDCVITNVGRVGAVSQVPSHFIGAIGRNITAIRPIDCERCKTFLAVALASTFMKKEIRVNTDSGTILEALNVRSIPNLRLPIVGIQLLEAFERLCGPMQAQRQNLHSESVKLIEIRDALLPRLISGELQIPEEMLVS